MLAVWLAGWMAHLEDEDGRGRGTRGEEGDSKVIEEARREK